MYLHVKSVFLFYAFVCTCFCHVELCLLRTSVWAYAWVFVFMYVMCVYICYAYVFMYVMCLCIFCVCVRLCCVFAAIVYVMLLACVCLFAFENAMCTACTALYCNYISTYWWCQMNLYLPYLYIDLIICHTTTFLWTDTLRSSIKSGDWNGIVLESDFDIKRTCLAGRITFYKWQINNFQSDKYEF